MGTELLIEIWCWGEEIGKLGYDEEHRNAYFQYHPKFLQSAHFAHIFPLLIKKTEVVQVFKQFEGNTFRGLPPMIADSLPDMFGNLLFNKWMESKSQGLSKIGPLEQLTYLANRGMGALEFKPAKKLPSRVTFQLDEVVEVLKKVLDNKASTSAENLDHEALLTIFKIGTSAGGIRPKILISEHKKSKKIIPGDVEISENYHHYLVKLTLEDPSDLDYYHAKIEYAYYLTARYCGIHMMESKLIDDKHFATLRFDRVAGKKIHVLSASGLTGWDFMDSSVSTYENLFDLALYLKIPQAEIDALFQRMVFNLVFFNIDDHLKNHSFCYDADKDRWHLAPAYDLTYSASLKLNRLKTNRALSVNHKRNQITKQDIMLLADKYAIKSPEKSIQHIQQAIPFLLQQMRELSIPDTICAKIQQDLGEF
ncbi:type II toxin-antitoxin system HipA family toxin [Aquirufa beregesia]